MPDSVQAGSIKITKFALSSAQRKAVDISNIISEFNIYESIFQEFTTINCIIFETSSLFTLFPLTGDETLTVEFTVDDEAFKKPYKYTFRIVSITDATKPEEVRTIQYRLRGIAPESFNDITKRVRRSYPADNSNGITISEMATKIFDTYLKTGDNSKLTVSESEGKHTYVIPNYKPSEALKFLCREAKSSKYPSSNYLFYSNADGFYFKTFDELVSELNGIQVDRYFLTDKQLIEELQQIGKSSLSAGEKLPVLTTGGIQAAIYGEKPAPFRKIINYKFNKIFDIEEKIQLGGFDNTVFYVDLNKSLYQTEKYNYKKDYDKLKWVDKGKVVNSQRSEMMNLKGDSHHRFIYVNKEDNSNVNKDQKQEFLHLQTASAAMMNYVNIDVTIPGDPGRRVGDHIEIAFPEYSRFEETKSLENIFVSGMYLVSSLRHTFNASTQGYTVTMQCLKNAYKNNPEKAFELSKQQTQNTQTPTNNTPQQGENNGPTT